ncbi:hypothetical protein NMG60_11008188 [Bertholletia excelsa]
MPQVINRYEKKFGSRNYQFTDGKVDFIAIDAQTLDGKSEGNFTSATWNFVKNVSRDFSSNPRVLLTHIPLYRPDWTSCGPHRSSRIINQRISPSALNQEILYQNYITEEKSNLLLDMIRPVLILSGHDHDQCTVTHISKHGPVEEHTLGTISWQQGNLYPSFMLLTASNPLIHNSSSRGNAVLTQLCFLPAQTYIYIWYLFLFVLTLLVLLLWPTNGIGFSNHLGRFMGYIRSLEIFQGATKEKSEDENCEYEMIWGADGSMHLIKKTFEAPAKPSTERNVVERGTAVLRPTAKKQVSQEAGSSVSLDVNVQMQMDAMGTKFPRMNKSKTKMVIRRLIRTFRMLSVIAAVNVPLYMMLLFKDWIDQ